MGENSFGNLLILCCGCGLVLSMVTSESAIRSLIERCIGKLSPSCLGHVAHALWFARCAEAFDAMLCASPQGAAQILHLGRMDGDPHPRGERGETGKLISCIYGPPGSPRKLGRGIYRCAIPESKRKANLR